MYNKRGQVTIFIIIAIVIVGVVVGFFLIRGNLGIENIPASIQPAYNSFLSCLEEKTLTGVDVLETQAGYIQLPALEQGNSYNPFSSQLNFLGNSIPYWYYLSANNIQKEQIPTKEEMEENLGRFIDDKIEECDFDSYYEEGFEITTGEPSATVTIKDNEVIVKLNMKMDIVKGEDTVLISSHEATVKSYLGTLYSSAKTLYEKEQSELFLENYGVDVLRLYAPVDGVELSCSSKVWDANQIFEDLSEAIETNTLALSTETPSTKTEKYFFVDSDINADARFINSKDWTSSFEVLPSNEQFLVADPVGTQTGLGAMGFCYVQYHFVYNVKYPVLVQVYKGDETFQFPVAVVIKGNKPRESLNASASAVTNDLCQYKNSEVTVSIYDTSLNLINSTISYECLGESCSIGQASYGTITASFPMCVNGYITVNADGFKETKYLYSTTEEGSVSIILDRAYEKSISLKAGGASYNGQATIYFTSDSDSKVVSYPSQKTVKLSEGQYNVSVYIYKNSSLKLAETTQEECIDVASSGLAGIFGVTEKNCFNVTIPAQVVSNALSGGGNAEFYVFESDLKDSNTIQINAESFTTPKTIEQLQNNYLLLDDAKLEVSFV